MSVFVVIVARIQQVLTYFQQEVIKSMTVTLSLPSDEKLLTVALELTRRASRISMHHFRNPLQISYKGDASPVTVADQETEREMRHIIQTHFPDHGIFGEEHGEEKMDRDIVWVLDPIDGTKSFISGIPLFGMLVSILVKDVPRIGIIHMPALEESFTGIRNQPSLHNDRRIRTRNCHSLAEALCFIGEGDKMLTESPGLFEKLQMSTRLTRFGYDCYPYGQLAMGNIDVVIERGLQPYDYLALIPIIEGAGGVITDWQGAPLSLTSKGDVIASATPQLHQEMLDLIRHWMEKPRYNGIAAPS